MKSNLLKKLMAASLTIGALAGCSTGAADDQSNNTDTTDTPSGAKLGDTVKIGLNFELSGEVADYGTKEINGARIAIEEFNAREDKPFTVEGVEIDDKGKPDESITAITKLIEQDGVVGVVGPATSASSIATYDFAASKAVPVISPSATQDGATMKSDGVPYEYAWRVCFEDSYQGKAMAEYAVNELGAKKAVVFNEASDYGRGLKNAFEEELKALGGETVYEAEYQSGDKDFQAIVTEAEKKDFDVVYIAGYYNETAQIVKALQADGVDKPIVGADGFDSHDFIKQIGAENANNIFYTTAYTTLDPSDELKAFIDKYKEEYNEEPSMFSALAYDATNLLLSSLEASGESGAALNEEIKKADFSGVTGKFSFDESTHTPNKSVLVVELVDGVQGNVKEVNAE